MTARRYGWAILIGGLAIAGIVLAVADISVDKHWPNPMSRAIVGPYRTVDQKLTTQTLRFDRTKVGEKLVLESPIVGFGPIDPYQALRAFLTNGAGLVLLALAGLTVFPSRARNSVERLESRAGPAIALGAGLVMALLTIAVLALLRFTLLFLAVVPLVIAVVIVAALFGVGCISLALGRLIHRRLQLPNVHPLVAALAGALVVFDVAVIPYAGVVAFAAVAMAGLGLAVVTRFGSAGGWSFVDLDW
ncbi:MAG TPA: hypothetical protein VGX27_05825 [Candidatus Dormibacteraeota bacterium]|nr:hypothetical protein [Candidatus Dormibacteraeota bacterium]